MDEGLAKSEARLMAWRFDRHTPRKRIENESDERLKLTIAS